MPHCAQIEVLPLMLFFRRILCGLTFVPLVNFAAFLEAFQRLEGPERRVLVVIIIHLNGLLQRLPVGP